MTQSWSQLHHYTQQCPKIKLTLVLVFQYPTNCTGSSQDEKTKQNKNKQQRTKVNKMSNHLIRTTHIPAPPSRTISRIFIVKLFFGGGEENLKLHSFLTFSDNFFIKFRESIPPAMNKMFNKTLILSNFQVIPPPQSPPPQKTRAKKQKIKKALLKPIPNHSSGVGESVATARPLAQH